MTCPQRSKRFISYMEVCTSIYGTAYGTHMVRTRYAFRGVRGTEGTGRIASAVLKVYSTGRYRTLSSTEGKGTVDPHLPSPQYKVYTSTVCAMGDARWHRMRLGSNLKSPSTTRDAE